MKKKKKGGKKLLHRPQPKKKFKRR